MIILTWKKDLLIPDSFLGKEVYESGYMDRLTSYVPISMPAPYEGYECRHPGKLVQATTVPLLMQLLYTDQFVFLLTKTDREPGKRYKRHRLSGADMIALFHPLAEAYQNRYYSTQLDVVKARIRRKGLPPYTAYGYLKASSFYSLEHDEKRHKADSFDVIAVYGTLTRMSFDDAYRKVEYLEYKKRLLLDQADALPSVKEFLRVSESEAWDTAITHVLGKTEDLRSAYRQAAEVLDTEIEQAFAESRQLDELFRAPSNKKQ